jgi:hypothetical protein
MNVKGRVEKLENRVLIKSKSWAVVEMREGEDEREKKEAYCKEHGCNEDELDWWIVVHVPSKWAKTTKI